MGYYPLNEGELIHFSGKFYRVGEFALKTVETKDLPKGRGYVRFFEANTEIGIGSRNRLNVNIMTLKEATANALKPGDYGYRN